MQDGQEQGQSPTEPGTVIGPGGNNQPTAELPPPTNMSFQPVAPATETTPPHNASTTSDGPGQIEWTASEYIANPKNAGWYALLAIGSLILSIIVFLLTRDVVPTVVIALLGIIVGIFAARQPQTLQYSIDRTGLHIGAKHYPYASFKAFSIAHEHAIGFIQLLPLKRFMPPLVIHYAPENEHEIAEVLSAYLPYEEHKADIVDNLTRRLRF